MNETPPPLSSSSIHEKLAAARELYSIWGERLLQDSTIAAGLAVLETAIAECHQAMFHFGIVAACRECEEEQGGSCCGAGIEDRYKPILLLVNLLLGCSLPPVRKSPNSCHFLGETGCVLKVRHILCLNYLCHKIQDLLTHEDLIALQTIMGFEMDAVFAMHEKVKRFVSH
jgi:hypothetical protein